MGGNLAEQPKNGSYTYEDYISWDEDERYELIDGYAYAMAAATPEHQALALEIAVILRAFLKGKPCKVYPDIDVRLFAKKTEKGGLSLVQKGHVLRPDLSVVCDPEQINEQGCSGAPSLIVEILSPSTAARDLNQKLYSYLQAGVQEYWIVSPADRWVYRYVLRENDYVLRVFSESETLVSERFPGLEINLSNIFTNE